MPEKIQSFCRSRGQPVPQTRGEILRVALESLVLKYRLVLEYLEALNGKRLAPIHIIGGGTQNRLLNQLTANCTGRSVVTGPVEATAIGNILLQAIALGHLDCLAQAPALVRRSFDVTLYSPDQTEAWDLAFARLKTLLNQNRS